MFHTFIKNALVYKEYLKKNNIEFKNINLIEKNFFFEILQNFNVNFSAIEMSVKYMNPVKCGSIVLVEINIEKFGKNINFLSGRIFKLDDIDNFSTENIKKINDCCYTEFIDNISKFKLLNSCLCTFKKEKEIEKIIAKF